MGLGILRLAGCSGALVASWMAVRSAWADPGRSPRDKPTDGTGVRKGPPAAESNGPAGWEGTGPMRPDAVPTPAANDDERGILDKTLGGRQFWGDVHHFRRWRIQQNVFTGHYRLLDPDDVRHASGTFEECRQKLDAIRAARKLPPLSGRAVVLVHGIIRSSKSFDRIAEELARSGAVVVPFDYPSTRVELEQAAKYLHRTLESLEGIERIDFVVHSLGGLVVRTYLGEHRDERIGRMVMLGVPNHGAEMADRVHEWAAFRVLFGPAGQQLGTGAKGAIPKLPVPDFDFAVIAGGRGTEGGWNPLIPGDDDGTVTVASTRLPGATDFLQVPVLHSFLMRNDEVIASTLRFLESGRLRATGDPQPIPKGEREAAVK